MRFEIERPVVDDPQATVGIVDLQNVVFEEGQPDDQVKAMQTHWQEFADREGRPDHANVDAVGETYVARSHDPRYAYLPAVPVLSLMGGQKAFRDTVAGRT